MSYVDTGDAAKGLVSSLAKWFFFRAVIYVAAALLSAGLFFVAVFFYARVQGPMPNPVPTTVPRCSPYPVRVPLSPVPPFSHLTI